MASGLTREATRAISRNGVCSRSISSSVALRSVMGLPVGKHIVPDKVPGTPHLYCRTGKYLDKGFQLGFLYLIDIPQLYCPTGKYLDKGFQLGFSDGACSCG